MRLAKPMLLAVPLVLLAPVELPRSSEPGLTFEKFHSTSEAASFFEALAARHPRWFRLETLGQSVQQRAIPLLAISDHSSEAPKAGIWIDGAIHGGELASAEPALAFAEELRERIAAGSPPAWLERVVIYVVPVINVDGRHLSLQPPFPQVRRNLRPIDDDGDGRVDEDGPADINGDGRIARISMRGSSGFEARDADGDHLCGEDPPGGVDLNRNFPVRRAERAEGWQPEPEVAAIVAFWERHPEIDLAFSYHTSASLLIWPPLAKQQPADERFVHVSSIYREHVNDRIWEFQEGIANLVGTSMEWFHSERGAAAFTVEMAALAQEFDEPTHAPTKDLVLQDCAGKVLVPRIVGGYSSASETQLERELPSLLARHVAFLCAVAEARGSLTAEPEQPSREHKLGY